MSYLKETIILLAIAIEAVLMCDKNYCQSLSNNVCTKATSLGNSDFNITVSQCSKGQFCNSPARSIWNNTNTQGSEYNFYCATIQNNQLVHGEKCNINTECGSNTCTGGRCLGKEKNEKCLNTIECHTGLYCDSILGCSPQKNESISCSIDEECVNHAGCYNNKCTEYWSLTPGTKVNQQQAEMYCNTSFAYEGVCHSTQNEDKTPYQCNENCTYRILETSSIVSLNSYCSCGYNNEGNKYCQHGSDSVSYITYKDVALRLLKSDCHVSKKYSCSNKIAYKEYMNYLNFYNTWKGHYQLSDTCLTSFYSSNAEYLSLKYILLFQSLILII